MKIIDGVPQFSCDTEADFAERVLFYAARAAERAADDASDPEYDSPEYQALFVE